MPSLVSVVTTTSSAATTAANIGTMTSSSPPIISCAAPAANGTGYVQRRRRRRLQQQQIGRSGSSSSSSSSSSYKLHGHSSTSSSSSASATSSMIMEPTMTPNAIVTITSVPLTIPSVAVAPVPPLLASKQLVVPNITIASIGQSTTSQLIPRTIQSLPTKSDEGTNMSTSAATATKFRRPGSVTGLDFNRSFQSTSTVAKSTFRLRSVVDSTVAANAIGHITAADESNLTNSDGGCGGGECEGEGELSNIIVVETNLDRQSSVDSVSTDFDPVKDLEWLNGVTTLPGSNLKFRYNEFGVMELITDGDINPQDAVLLDGSRSSRPINATECKEVVDAHSTSSARGSARKRRRSVALRDEHYGHQGTSKCESLLPEIAVGSIDDHSSEMPLDSKVNLPQSTDSSVSSPVACLQSNDAKETADDEILHEGATSQAMDEPSHESPQSAAPRSEKRGRPLGSKNVNSNKKFKSIFSWTTYLEQTKSIAAPTKCFREAFPCGKNGFRVGMKLEAVDPVHQSLFCVVSVAEVRGFRLRLHFDGFSDCYDFWVNADSTDIFKAGWCEKTNHKLEPPKGFAKNEFNWVNYLKLSKALSAPKHLFANKSSNCVTPHGFRVGMKLEAVDKKTVFMDRRNSSTSLVCVATISDVMDNRILIHFDGWDTIYDYWSDSTSPYIHPVGWCQEKGHVLMPPNKCKDPEHFTWEAYLTKSKCQAAPARAFKQRSPIGFKKGMSLEATDPRNPSLIRVATVAEVGNHQVKLHFDGWAETYDFWLDDESPEIHPVTWCEKTGHPLEPPPSKDYCVMVSGQGSGCPTLGCKGVGHIRGPKYTTHHSSFGCPYSHSNLSKDMGIPDRVKTAKEPKGTEAKNKSCSDHPPKCSTFAPSSAAACDEGEPSVPNPKLSSFPMESASPAEVVVSGGEESMVGATHSAVESSSSSCRRRGRGRRKRKQLLAEDHDHSQLPGDLRFGSDASSDSNSSLKCDSRSSVNSSLTSTSGPASIASELSSIVHRSIFMPGGNDHNRNGMCGISAEHTLASFRRHAKLLPGLARLRGVDVGRWTVDQVTDFVRTLPGCQEVAKAFKDEQIDGEAFVLLNQADIVNLMNIKLGPALKIYNSIVMLHHMTAES